jgi:L-methionine (R)-S-oxide reductase
MKKARKSSAASRKAGAPATPPAASSARGSGAGPARGSGAAPAQDSSAARRPAQVEEVGLPTAPEPREIDPRAYEEIRRLLAGVLREAASAFEARESVCNILYEELDHYSWVGIYLVDGDDLELASWAGPEETEHTRIPIGEGICGLAAATGETELVPDVRENDRFIACFPSTRSEIVVPILREREVLGEIDVDSDVLDAFDEEDVRLLEWTAARLAGIP